MTDTINIGVVGLGAICRERHVPGFKRIPGVSLRAVCNRTLASTERAARDADIPVVCSDWRQILGRDDIDMVLVGTWPYMHCEVSVAALEAGKHVFCQARMARDAVEAGRMRNAARSSGLVAGLCPVPIGMHIDRVVERLLREGAIGAARFVSVRSFSNAWSDPNTPLTWRKDGELSGLNMQTLGMYIEVVHRWFGWTTQVSADSFLYTPMRTDSAGRQTEVKVPDQFSINTVVGADLPVHYVISGVSSHTGDTIDIYGDKGALHYDVNRDTLYFVTSGGLEPVTPLKDELYDVDHWDVEQRFIDAIRKGSEYHPDFEDGLRYMQVVQAAHDSAAEQRHIHL